MFQIGSTKFFIRPHLQGWEVLYEELGDKNSRYFDYKSCWDFFNLEDLLGHLPDLARGKIKSRSEKIQADPRAVEKWLKAQALRMNTSVETEKALLTEVVKPLTGFKLADESFIAQVLDTPYQLHAAGTKGWEIYQRTPEGKLLPIWHFSELSNLLRRVPMLLAEHDKTRRNAPEDLLAGYENNLLKTRKWVKKLLSQLQPAPKPPSKTPKQNASKPKARAVMSVT